MLGRHTRNLFVKLVRALHAGTERLVLRLEAGERRTEAEAGEGDVAQDPARSQFVNRVDESPPAHWLEVVRRHAPQLLNPVSGRHNIVTALRKRSERGVAPDSGALSTLGRQPAPPAAGQKTTAAARHEPLPGPRRSVRRTSVSPELETKAANPEKCSVTLEGAQPQIRARHARHLSVDETSVQASRAVPRKEPVVHPVSRALRQPLDAGAAQLPQRPSSRPGETQVLQPPLRSKVYDSCAGPTETLRGFNRSEHQEGSLDTASGQERQIQTQSNKRPDGAQAVKQRVVPARQAMQAAAQATPRAERSSTPTCSNLLRSLPALGTPPAVQRPPRSTGETVARPIQAEPEWPRLPDERDGDLQSTRTADRWPSLPEYAWDPGARLSPSEALRVASEERRNRLRLRRRDLEQRGELWSV